VTAHTTSAYATIVPKSGTTFVNTGTSLSYTISGVTASDLTSGVLTGTTVVGSDGTATITIGLIADQLTEDVETLTLSIQG
jgi:hypothetical protein